MPEERRESYTLSDSYFTNWDGTKTRCIAIYYERLDLRETGRKGKRVRKCVKRFSYHRDSEKYIALEHAQRWIAARKR